MAHLLGLAGVHAGQRLPLDRDRTVLGRNTSSDVVFPADDFSVSREHACVLRLLGGFVVEDLGSRNGTYVNGQLVSARTPLRENDRLQICDYLYTFHEALPADPAESGRGHAADQRSGMTLVEASVGTSSQVILQSQPAEKVRVLIEITNNLSKTLELDNLLPKIVENLFQLFKQADRVFILLREAGAGAPADRLVPKVVRTRYESKETGARYSRSIVRECIETMQALLSEDASQDERFDMSQSIAEFRIRSVMCAPLCAQDGRILGVIQLDTQDRRRKFTAEDLSLLMAVANQASVALENAHLHAELVERERMRRDLELAYQVQQSFLPQQMPEVPGYEFAARYEPAQAVGGDYYDFIDLAPRRLAILLGDVSGKGIPASLLMAKLSSDARTCLHQEADPARAIGRLNRLVHRHAGPTNRFVTLAVALLDTSTHLVTLINAGHPTPLVIRAGASEPQPAIPEQVRSLPLGILEETSYRAQTLTLEPGDALLFFSDGVTEAMDREGRQVNLEAIQGALRRGPRTPGALVDAIEHNLRHYATGRSQHDDITLVCVGRTAE